MAKKIDINGLDHFKEKENAMIASEYSSSKTYAVGDYCFHAGTLYECTTAITTAEAWTSGHWTAAKLAEDTSALKTAITQELFTESADASKWSQGYWAIANGVDNPNSNSWIKTTTFLPDDVVRVYDNSNLLLYLQSWNKTSGNYVGTWNGTQWSTTYTAGTGLLDIDLTKFRKDYPDYKFKITVTKTDGSNIDPATNGAQIYFVYSNVIDIKSDISVVRENGIHLRKKLSENNSTPYIYRDLIPAYYFAQEQYPTSYDDNEYLQKKISSVPDGKHFIFITDRHWERNAKKSTMLVSYVASKLGVNFIVDGGDSITREDTTENVEGRYLACKVLQSCLNGNYDSWGYKYLPVIGNHDINTANPPSTTAEALATLRISYDALVNILFSSLNGETVHYAPSEKLHTFLGEDQTDYNVLMDYFSLNYYIDDESNKIRFIIYNTGNPYNGVVSTHFGRSGTTEPSLILDWLYDVLYNTPENYDIVVIGHEPTYETGNLLTNTTKPVPQMVAARKQKVRTKVYLNESSEGTGWISNGNHYYDFRAASNVGKVFMLGGHWHRDYIVTLSGNTFEDMGATLTTDTEVEMSGATNYPLIYTQCDAYNVAIPTPTYHEMTLDTVTEQCFDIVTITTNGIACTRIGAGVDRTVTFT